MELDLVTNQISAIVSGEYPDMVWFEIDKLIRDRGYTIMKHKGSSSTGERPGLTRVIMEQVKEER